MEEEVVQGRQAPVNVPQAPQVVPVHTAGPVNNDAVMPQPVDVDEMVLVNTSPTPDGEPSRAAAWVRRSDLDLENGNTGGLVGNDGPPANANL